MIYSITNHSYLAVLVVQSAFSVALTVTAFLIAKTIFDERVGVLTALLVAFHPGLVYYDVFNLLPLSIETFLIAAITLGFLKLRSNPTWKYALLIGCLIGLGTLSRGILGMLFPLLAAYCLLFLRTLSLGRRLRLAAFVLIAGFTVMSPWIIRNYLIHRKFVLVTSTNTENFWRGNNPYATGTSTDANKVPIIRLTPVEFQRKVSSLTEMEKQGFFRDEALTFIRERPMDALKLYLRKVYYFWWFSPQSGINYSRQNLIIYATVYSIIGIFSLLGLIFGIRSNREGVRESSLIILGVMMIICLGQSAFYVEGRHRWLIEPLLLIFFSSAMIKLWALLRSKVAA